MNTVSLLLFFTFYTRSSCLQTVAGSAELRPPQGDEGKQRCSGQCVYYSQKERVAPLPSCQATKPQAEGTLLETRCCWSEHTLSLRVQLNLQMNFTLDQFLRHRHENPANCFSLQTLTKLFQPSLRSDVALCYLPAIRVW